MEQTMNLKRNRTAFWRGFGSVLTIAQDRKSEAFDSRDASVEAAKMVARAWENVGSTLRGAMDEFDQGRTGSEITGSRE